MRRAREPDPRIAQLKEVGESEAPPGTPRGEIEAALEAVAVRALRFIRETQEPEGPWWGRWGVNYIYGTWQVLRGLAAIDEDMNLPYVRRAVEWLKSVQLPDGGWGETCATYEDPSLKGKGPATPSQTPFA